MITFFKKGRTTVYAVDSDHALDLQETQKLEWLLDGQKPRRRFMARLWVLAARW